VQLRKNSFHNLWSDMYKIKYDSPTLGKGEIVTVTGIGELRNGEFSELPDEADATFQATNGIVSLDEENNAVFTLGLGLEDYFKDHELFTVEHVKDKPSTTAVDKTTTNTDGGANA